MKVILLQDVRGLGKKWDVKDVSDGYAKNALLPKKLAQVATPEDVLKLTAQKALAEKQAKEQREKLGTLAKNLAQKELTFFVKTGAKKEVFGSVTAEAIKKALHEQGIEVQAVSIPKPLKALGEHHVELVLGMGVSGKVKVKLLPQK